MSRLKILVLSSAMMITTILNSQYSGFDLAKYKLPDIKLNRLDFNLNLNQTKSNNIIDPSQYAKSKVLSDYFYGTLNLDYFHFRNSEKYQGNINIDLNIQPSLNTTRDNGLVVRSNNLNIDFLISSTNRFFIQKLIFFEIDPELSLNSGRGKNHRDFSSTSAQDYKTDQFTKTASIPVSVGHGRIEPVEDARLAIYILEELNKVGRISTLPPDNVVLEMAKVISKIKNKRFFDSRIRKIEELQMIDSFLVANKLISSDDISYFAVLNDQWDYASGPVREAGFAINAGIDNYASQSNYSDELTITGNTPSKNEQSSNLYRIGGFIQVKKAKPINLYWQNSFEILLSAGREFNRNPKEKDSPVFNYESDIVKTYLRYSWQYLPNSRTSLGLDLNGTYQYSSGNRNSGIANGNYSDKGYNFSLYPAFNINYYVSPQLRIIFNSVFSETQARSTARYENGAPDSRVSTRIYHHDISFRLVYSFF
jgi:hypothetical protein